MLCSTKRPEKGNDMDTNALEIRPYASALGAEVLNVDLRTELDDATWSVIHQAFLDYCVLFFRDQPLTLEQHIAFSKRFGELEPYPYNEGFDGYPEIVEVVKLPDEVHNFGSGWHTDMSFREKPPLGAVLCCKEIPPAGGDTLFANMYLAYDTLSEGMKEMVSRLNAVHYSHTFSDSFEPFKGMKSTDTYGEQSTVHPLIRTHPETGKVSLFLSPDYCVLLEDMSPEESRAILEPLEKHATRHEFSCRFRWQRDSIAVWDNRCIMHQALEDDHGARLRGKGFKRVMRRSTIKV